MLIDFWFWQIIHMLIYQRLPTSFQTASKFSVQVTYVSFLYFMKYSEMFFLWTLQNNRSRSWSIQDRRYHVQPNAYSGILALARYPWILPMVTQSFDFVVLVLCSLDWYFLIVGADYSWHGEVWHWVWCTIQWTHSNGKPKLSLLDKS